MVHENIFERSVCRFSVYDITYFTIKRGFVPLKGVSAFCIAMVCVYLCISVYLCVSLCISVHLCASLCISVHLCVFLCISVYLCVSLCRRQEGGDGAEA